DRAAGHRPCFAVATIGSTSRNAVDPVAAIAALCREAGVWLHVDAAMAGSAALCPELRHHFAGLELADSYCFNPHKWLFTNFDCDAFFVADRAALTSALSVTPEYLRNPASEQGGVIDYRDWQVPLGRRFRALKLWFVLRWYGAEGLRDHLRRHMAWAREFADRVDQDADFERLAAVPFSLVCFRHRAGDAFNARLLAALNDSGALLLSHTVIDGRYALRLSVGATHTERRHVEQAWTRIRATATALAAQPAPAGNGAPGSGDAPNGGD
ncbi:MAG: aspartate aminotransferase family protein, partial [Pseudomonadota bacterium]|nr:aspartate aminotransferase family protein [Pseudomonadota bacterium]